jgi:hypothetical protein
MGKNDSFQEGKALPPHLVLSRFAAASRFEDQDIDSIRKRR